MTRAERAAERRKNQIRKALQRYRAKQREEKQAAKPTVAPAQPLELDPIWEGTNTRLESWTDPIAWAAGADKAAAFLRSPEAKAMGKDAASREADRIHLAEFERLRTEESRRLAQGDAQPPARSTLAPEPPEEGAYGVAPGKPLKRRT